MADGFWRTFVCRNDLGREGSEDDAACQQDQAPAGVDSLNAGFCVALAEHPDAASRVVRVYTFASGPFAGDWERTKRVRLVA